MRPVTRSTLAELLDSLFRECHPRLPEAVFTSLFRCPWVEPGSPIGYAAFERSTAVAFLGVIVAGHPVRGRTVQVGNLTSFVVKPGHEHLASLLALTVSRRLECTLTNFTCSPEAYPLFRRIGMVPLDTRTRLLPVLPYSWLRDRAVRVEVGMGAVLPSVQGWVERVCVDHCGLAEPVLIQSESGACLVIGTRAAVARLRGFRVHYVSSPSDFVSHLPAVLRGLRRAFRTDVLEIDERLLHGCRTRRGMARRLKVPRLYRPATDVDATDINGLYSERTLLNV